MKLIEKPYSEQASILMATARQLWIQYGMAGNFIAANAIRDTYNIVCDQIDVLVRMGVKNAQSQPKL